MLLGYFVRHPEAADTCEGIVRWRLKEEWVDLTTEETASALDWLVSHEYLKKVPALGLGSLFTLNQERLTEAAEFLGGADSRSAPRPSDP